MTNTDICSYCENEIAEILVTKDRVEGKWCSTQCLEADLQEMLEMNEGSFILEWMVNIRMEQKIADEIERTGGI